MRVSLLRNKLYTCFDCGDIGYVKITGKWNEFCLCRRHFNTLKSKVMYIDKIEKGEIEIGKTAKRGDDA